MALLITVLLLFAGLGQNVVEAGVNAIFVFGDSTMDVGNNNHLKNTTARADDFYNGIDFPTSTPTGRFSNGFNTADELAKLLGFPMSPPPFLSLTPTNLTKQMLNWGINFASGGSGLLDDTGHVLAVNAISMRRQTENFARVTHHMTNLMGSAGTANFLSKCLFLVSSGSNDMFEYSYQMLPNKTELLCNLTSTYKSHLRALYELGARKFGIVGIPPLGCCPYQRARNDTGDCNEELNDLAKLFHQAIGLVLQELHKEFPQMRYALANAYNMVATIFENPLPFKLNELQIACCGSGRFHGEAPCNAANRDTALCANRNEYFFWDLFHPTQVVSKIAAETFYSASKKYVTPINIKQLVHEDT